LANDNDQNNQQNQQKQKGGGGGGGSGLALSAKFDASAPGGLDNMANQILGHGSNAVGFVVGAVVAGMVFKLVKKNLGIKDVVAPGQGGGGGQIHPGQLTGGLFNLKKSDPAKFAEIMEKVNS
jgi:hypothetical protein